MGVRIDAARHHEAAGGIEHRVAREPLPDRRDRLALDQHVGREAARRRHDRSALDHQSTSVLLPWLLRMTPDQATISAFSSTACISTCVPALAHSGLMSSASLWLTPSTQGVKIIEVGATRAM